MNPDRSALIVVDMQHYFVEPDSSLMALVEHLQPGSVAPYFQRVEETVIPAIQGLLRRFRALRSPIFFTQFGSRSADGSDLPLWARRINDMSLATFARLAYPEFEDSSAAVIPALSPESFAVVFGQAMSANEISGEL